MSFFRRFRDAIISAALLAVPFFFLNANLKDPGRMTVLDRMILTASAPIQYVATQFAHGVSTVIEDYVYLVEVKADNEKFRANNAYLRAENSQLLQYRAENKRLRALLGVRDSLQGESITAQVISKEFSPFFRVIRVALDRGDRDRIHQGMPVVSSEGLVGQIRRTWSQYSDVLLTVDRTSAIDVVIQRTGARGMLRGTGETNRYLCRIEDLGLSEDVKVGDLIHTSGHGQRFPAGLLVGRVAKLNKPLAGLFQEAEVKPAANFSALEEVVILTAGSRSETILNSAETPPAQDNEPIDPDLGTPVEESGSAPQEP